MKGITAVDIAEQLLGAGFNTSYAFTLAKMIATKDDIREVMDAVVENRAAIMEVAKENRAAINRLADKIEGTREGRVNRRSNALWGIIGTAVGATVAWILARLSE